MKVVKCLGTAFSSTEGPVGQYLVSFDKQIGESVWSFDLAKAMKFPSTIAAFQFVMTVLESDPVRPDGKPNRPLTAFTVTIMEAVS